MYAAGPPYCPTCGQLDQVRKASALYGAGTTFSPDNGYHWSALALRMQPPAPPAAHRRASTCLGLLLFPLVLLIGSCLLLDAIRVTIGTALPLVDAARQLAAPALITLGVFAAWALARWGERRAYAVQAALYAAELRAWEERFYWLRCDDTFVPLPPSASTSYTARTIRIYPCAHPHCPTVSR